MAVRSRLALIGTLIGLLLIWSPVLAAPHASPAAQSRSKGAALSSTEVFVGLQPTVQPASLALALARPQSAAIARAVVRTQIEPFLALATQQIVMVVLQPGADPTVVVQELAALPEVAWAAPNRIYNSDPNFDPREYTPTDPRFVDQYHHTRMQTPAAWDITEGQGMLIGIIDDGVELVHPDLNPNIWQNDDPLDGIDNDGNGYIDDTNGWSVVNNTRSVSPSGVDSHGTHVAGIAAARTNNGIGVAGTAGRSTILPIKFYSTGAPWTSAIVAEALRYAADNGSKITNMSYNIDGFVGDPIVTAALEYAYSHGVLMLNSAGNESKANPVRQAYNQVLFVANTNSSDLKSISSNYGTGIDISAPGELILSTVSSAYAAASLPPLATPYEAWTGTSMATPNAAGVAALIWAAHPTWTRDQVAAYLVGTSDSIESLNPTYAGMLGRGRVNAARGVNPSFQLPPPQVQVQGLPADNGIQITSLAGFTLLLPFILDSTTVISTNFDLRSDGIDGLFGTSDDTLIPFSIGGLPYQIGSNRLTISIPSTLLPERYRFTARSGVSGLRDPFNQQLDGNANGTGGDDFTRTFTVNYQLYGQVFEDWNNNGLNDTGEPPIAGQTIWLDLNNSGTLNAGDASTTSNAQGSYSFSGITPGATVLHITPSANMQISTPSGGSKNLVLGANDANARLDLGLYEVQAIYGHAFNDNNRDGIRNSGELGLPNWQVYVDANQNGVYDVGSPQIYSSTAQVAIPDNDAVGITNTLTVAGAPSSIVDLNVTLTISHTYVSDLKIVLTAPNGTQIALVNQRGAANQDLAGVTLDDQATQPISSLAGSPTQGTYRPESPLSAVNQLSGNGDWKLWISDPLAGDSGTLRGWRLTMTSGDSLATTDANGAFRFSNRVLGTHVLRQIRPVGWRATVPLSEMRSLNITNGASLFDNDFGNQIITQEYWFAFLPFVQR